MNRPVVIADHGVTVIGGGFVQPDDLALALDVAPLLVAADGGADQALALGHLPDRVIGDLDSLSDAARARIGTDRILHLADQDSTDFTKCLTRIAAPFIIAVGFAGRRLDHTLAALNSMLRFGQVPVIMLASDDLVFVAPPRLSLPLAPGTRLSLFPMGPAQGVSSGLEWPIDGIAFGPDSRIGTSNRATGPVTLHIDGPMLVMLPRQELATVMAALQLPHP